MSKKKRLNTMIGMGVLVIMLMVATFLVVGCEKEKEPTQSGDMHINPEYVSIDWGNAILLSYDDSTGKYQIQFDGKVPDVHPGSILAIDQDTVVHYIFVENVRVSGNMLSITATEASLTDIFYDSEFTLSTVAEGKSDAKGIVFYPVEAYLMDENNGYQVLNIDGRKEDTRFTHNLWHYGFNHDGYVVHSGSNDSIVLDQMNMDLDLDMEMYMNFGGRDVCEVVGSSVERWRSKVMKVSAALVGRFNTEQKIRCKVWGSCRYAPDYDLWKHNLFRPLPIRFIVGGVPIVLTLRSDLFRQVEVSANGEIQVYTGFTDHAEGRVGFDWQQTNGMVSVATFENTFGFTPPTVEGKGQIQAKVWAFPRISVMLEDVIGPSFDFMPYLSDTLRGGFREQILGQTNDYCAWSLDCHTGLDLRCGLSLRFFGYEVENYSTPKWNCIDKKLYHSPKKVLHVSGRPQVGQSAKVQFSVYDTSYLTNQSVMTPLPQIVKFEASGELSSEYGIAHDGTVSVDWIPNGDTLWAKLYDDNGRVLAWDTVIVKCDCNLTEGDWVDLGLPSGLLWATRNVGASSPTGYGDYFAWGETSPKGVYLWSTYQYGNSEYNLTKYCYDSSYGCNDGLTTLQSGDDAATANYGGRIPSPSEWEELINNTTNSWMSINGVIGRCFTGANGNSIFFPAAGYRWGSSLYYVGNGYYCTNKLRMDYPYRAYGVNLEPTGSYLGYQTRNDGFSVRAVSSVSKK